MHSDRFFLWTRKPVSVTYGYEQNRNLKTQVKNAFNSNLVSQYDYTYDALGRRKNVKWIIKEVTKENGDVKRRLIHDLGLNDKLPIEDEKSWDYFVKNLNQKLLPVADWIPKQGQY